MLGASDPKKKKTFGYRNRYCVNNPSEMMEILSAMVKEDLVRPGDVINEGRSLMFHATIKGCRTIGFSSIEMRRVFEE